MDCKFHSKLVSVNRRVQATKLACFFGDIKILFKHKFHYEVKDVAPLEVVKNNDIPVLFIHGAEDHFIKLYHQKRIADNQKGYKKVIQIPHAGHGDSFNTNPRLYQEEIASFIKELARVE